MLKKEPSLKKVFERQKRTILSPEYTVEFISIHKKEHLRRNKLLIASVKILVEQWKSVTCMLCCIVTGQEEECKNTSEISSRVMVDGESGQVPVPRTMAPGGKLGDWEGWG